AGPRAVLRPRWLRDGHVPDAGHRPGWGLWRSRAARLHGVPRLEAAALVLARLRAVPPAGAAGGPRPRAPGLRLRLVCLPLAGPRRLLLHHHPGADLRGDAALLPEPDRVRG